MPRQRRLRIWLEIFLAAATFTLAIATILVGDWIEIVFGMEPDRGTGWLEVAVTAGLGLAGVALSVAARIEWLRPAKAWGDPR